MTRPRYFYMQKLYTIVKPAVNIIVIELSRIHGTTYPFCPEEMITSAGKEDTNNPVEEK